jgi:hypothetical protein
MSKFSFKLLEGTLRDIERWWFGRRSFMARISLSGAWSLRSMAGESLAGV